MKNKILILFTLILFIGCKDGVESPIKLLEQSGRPSFEEAMAHGTPSDCEIVTIDGCKWLQSEFTNTNGKVNHLYQHMPSCKNPIHYK